MEYLQKFNEDKLCDLILKTKGSLFIALPLLHPKVIKSIDQLKNSNESVSINIGLDFSPESFRQGYGEIDSYKGILDKKYNVKNLIDNRISFVMSDDEGYLLFFESRYLVPAEKETLNAVKIDPVSMIRIKQYFFDAFNLLEFQNMLSDAVIDEGLRLKQVEVDFDKLGTIISAPLDKTTLDKVVIDLETNPPLKPDFQRIVSFYINKFQYVQMEFVGAHTISKKITLPKNAIPLNDSNLRARLEAKLSLFDKESAKDPFKPLDDLNIEIEKLREKYLTKLKSRRESILVRSKKVDFDNELKSIREKIESLKKDSIDEIHQEIEKTKKNFLDELISFYVKNIDELKPINSYNFRDPSNKWDMAENLAKKIFYKIKWPEANDIFSGLRLSVNISDITFEDLKNDEFKKELKEKKLITDLEDSSLADFGKGVEVADEI